MFLPLTLPSVPPLPLPPDLMRCARGGKSGRLLLNSAGVGEVAQCVRAIPLDRDLSLIANSHVGDSELLVTPAPEDVIPLSDCSTYLYTCVHIHTNTYEYTQTKIKNSF